MMASLARLFDETQIQGRVTMTYSTDVYLGKLASVMRKQ
jgi:hypothetical protein